MLEETFYKNTQILSKSYCLLKYKQDQEFKLLKDKLNIELEQLRQDIIEEGISKRNVDNHRSAFEKLINTSDFENPNSKKLTNVEQAEFIFQMMLDTINNSTSNNLFSYRERYIRANETIIKYFTRYFDIKDELNALKQKHKLVTDKLVFRIKEEDVPLFIVKYVYKRLKLDLGVNKISKDELSYSEKLYESLREDLFEEIKNV